MSPEERKEKLETQSNELFCAYGRFAVKFEHVCHGIHNAITHILSMQGLKNQQIANILLAGLTAEPLRSLFAALVSETSSLNPSEQAIFNNILTRIQSLTSKRNDIIHATWFIGWASEQDTDFSKAPGYKHHKSNKGASIKSHSFTVEDFNELTNEAESISKMLLVFSACLVFERSIENNFTISENSHASVK